MTFTVICPGALPSWLSASHAEKVRVHTVYRLCTTVPVIIIEILNAASPPPQVGIVDVLSHPLDEHHVGQLLTRLHTGTLYTNLHSYLQVRMGRAIASSDSGDDTAHALLFPTEYSRQGSVTQEPWDVSCDNLQVLLVDEAGERIVAGDGELWTETVPTYIDAPQRTDASVVGSKRDLESCLSSEPAQPVKVCNKAGFRAWFSSRQPPSPDAYINSHQATFQTRPRGWLGSASSTRCVLGPCGAPGVGPSSAWYGFPAQLQCG